MFEIYGGQEKFTQWSKDQKLVVKELPVGSDVQFYNDPNEDDPLITEVYEIFDEEGNAIRVCNVPNIYFTSTNDIKVCVAEKVRGANGTIHSVIGSREKIFKVEVAEKPADYVYEETPVSNLRWSDMKSAFYSGNASVPYVEEEDVVIREHTVVPLLYDEEEDYMHRSLHVRAPMEAGEVYYVTFNGIEYECEPAEELFPGVLNINPYWPFDGHDWSPGDPFWIIYYSSSNTIEFIALQYQHSECTLSILKKGGTVNKLDMRCLPESHRFGEEVKDIAVRRYGSEMCEALKFGDIVNFMIDMNGDLSKYEVQVKFAENENGPWLIDGKSVTSIYYFGNTKIDTSSEITNIAEVGGLENLPGDDVPFLVVWASGSDMVSDGTYVNFEIDANGEKIERCGTIKRATTMVSINKDYLPKADAVADVTAAPTAAQFNALLASLRKAGYLAT